MTDRKVMKLASRGKRFGAGVIDLAIPYFAYVVFLTILSANGFDPNASYSSFGDAYEYGYEIGNRISGAPAAIMSMVSFVMLAYVVLQLVFFSKGKSIGKVLLGLQVVSSVNGRPFGFWKMLFRDVIVKQASGVLLIGFIWILFDSKNRAWHDKILDSYVVDLKESEKMRLMTTENENKGE